MPSQLDLIKKFLKTRRIAVVGVSRNPSDFSRTLWNEFRNRGFEAIPVHPDQPVIDGIACCWSVQEIEPRPEAALILAGASWRKQALEACVSAGIDLVWIYGIRGEKEIEEGLIEFAAERKIDLIAGFCPFMFLPGASWFHRVHGTAWKLLGYYPR